MRRQTPFDQLYEVPALMQAWKQVRHNQGAAGVDLVTIAEYLPGNLRSLAGRLYEQRYYPMPLRTFEMEKPNGSVARWASSPWRTALRSAPP